jgi:hypothetical protein
MAVISNKTENPTLKFEKSGGGSPHHSIGVMTAMKKKTDVPPPLPSKPSPNIGVGTTQTKKGVESSKTE